MLAQAEHDGDARARALVPSRGMAAAIEAAIEKRLAGLSTAATARTSLDSGGLIVVYSGKAEAVRIADTIAPEHLELQGQEVETWPTDFTNFGALFIGEGAAEVLGDYSAGTNHTLPTSGSARFTGGLSVRHFLKTVTTLRCVKTGNQASGIDGGNVGDGYAQTVRAAEIIAEAEGLIAHKESAAKRA
jgi:histidinol dehydrogenase